MLDQSGPKSPAPLRNVEVILTRAKHQIESTAQHFEALGAEVIRASTIVIEEPPTPENSIYQRGTWMIPKVGLGRMLWRFDWVIFTSVNAVKYADKAWQKGGQKGGLKAALRYRPKNVDTHKIRAIRVACIGDSTQSALNRLGVQVDLIPSLYHAEGLIDAFDREILDNKRILIPRALVARELLPEALRVRGAEVWITPLYQTTSNMLSIELKRQMIQRLEPGKKRALLFTSDSTLNRLVEQLTPPEVECLKRICKVFVIGPVIKRSALREGFKVSVVAEPHTIKALIESVITFFQQEEA
jgi:uroporphyrinogen III methyltransferase / synthase